MYKPPQNSNRVRSIKNKFENIENRKEQDVPISSSKLVLKNFENLHTITNSGPINQNFRNSQSIPYESHTRNSHQLLSRQLSDPLKRNIKRTPAFRLDMNAESVAETVDIQNNNLNQKTLFETKVKQFNSVKSFECNFDKKTFSGDESNSEFQGSNAIIKNCDASYSLSDSSDNKTNNLVLKTNANGSSSDTHKTDSHDLKSPSDSKAFPIKTPLFIKSKSSHDFKYIRSKFNKDPKSPPDALELPLKNTSDIIYKSNTQNKNIKTDEQCNITKTDSNEDILPKNIETDANEDILPKNIDLSLIYTEPTPKSLRNKNSSESSTSNESPLFKPKHESIHTTSTLQLTEKKAGQNPQAAGLTDSLKVALNKPLPNGPPPKKPPRTFQHCVENAIAPKCQKNTSFLHSFSEKNGKKSDPKYMLNKLETALKSNKLTARKQSKVEVSTTSGEDSDDSLLFRSKSCRSLPKLPIEDQDFSQSKCTTVTSSANKLQVLGNLGCLPLYAKGVPSVPKFPFCVGTAPEPIYAELTPSTLQGNGNGTGKNNLHYMVSSEKIKPAASNRTKKGLARVIGIFRPCPMRLSRKSTAIIPDDTGVHRVSIGPSTTTSNTTPIIPPDSGANSVMVGPTLTIPNDFETKIDEPSQDCGTSDLNRQFSADNTSLSSLASDLDFNPSCVMDDSHVKIRHLIEHFEARRKMLPNVERPTSQDQDRCSDSVDCSKRVERLRNSLIKTIDQSFKSGFVLTSSRDDSDSEKNEEGKVASMVDRFNTYQKTAHKYQQPKINTETLFYCCLVIEKVQDCAQIKLKFPPHVDVHPDIEKLCFPESPDSPPLEGSSAAQTYTLLITNETGDRTYGYCRRVLPEGGSHCLPLAYCILSKYRSPKFYKRILIELESRHGMQNKFRDELISQFYYKTFPKPGESITINLSSIDNRCYKDIGLEESVDLASYIQVNKTGEHGNLNNNRKTAIFVSKNDIVESYPTPSYVTYQDKTTELVVTLHPDPRYEDADLENLHKLPSDILLKIFSSLLLERKVILISSVISKLSSCVESLQSILYPFTWYHTFIPILPESLWVIVECPTPFVCGVLSQDAIKDRHIENGMVVNLDTQTVLVEEGDEMKILSSSLHKVWRQFITLANNTKSRQYAYSVFLADAYLYVLICCFKHYKQYIVNGKFLKDKLVSDAGTRGRRRFLKMFTETCMFQAFMDAALSNPESLAAFDKQIEFYGSDESRVILNKLIDWHR